MGIIIISETISIREENSHLYQNLYAMSVDEWGGRNNKQENTYGIPEIEEDIQEEEILAEMMWPGEDYFIHSDFSFAFLWDNPEDNRDSISAAQSYFHNYGYLTGAWSTLTEITDWDYFSVGKGVRDKVAYQTLMKFLYDYRTTIDLPGIANSYLPYLNRIIPEETYTKTGMRTTVHQLLLTYDDIMEENQDVNRLIEIGKVMDENGKMYIPDESYEEEEKRFFHAVAALTHAADYAEEFTGWSGRTDYQRITWAYSFWTRRYYEGIHQEVHTILKQIEQVYQET
ncbi:MAG: hypothetical protein LIP01_05655 [Tannerellaceae bacterium]|nr:hypothetical protein [Tannerellaceae bacterium]